MLGIHPSVSTFVPMRSTVGVPRTGAVSIPQANVNQSSSSSSGGTGLEVISPIRPHVDPSITFDFEPVLEKMNVAKPVLRVADPKFKTIVCVHWYNGLCMKGDNCEFLHEMDMDRMPECRAGERCTDKLCPFKHLKAEERPICNNYNLGFCQHGLTCRFQHRKRPPEELALVCDYANIIHIPRDREHGQEGFNVVNMGGSSSQQHGESSDGLVNPNPALTRQQNIRRQLNYRTALCNSFSKTGTCTYGDNCDYAHSEEERQRNIALRNQALPNRQIPAGVVAPQNIPGQPMPKRALASPLDRIVLSLREWTDADGIDAIYATPLALPPPAGERLPVSVDDHPRYFVLRSADYEYLARSVVSNRWLVHPSFAGPFNAAFDSNSQVFFFFAVDGEEGCFGGVARMKSHFIIKPNNNPAQCETSPAELPEIAEGTIEWLRVNELPYKKTAYLTAVDPIVQRELPVALCIEGQELPPSVGRCLMTMSYREGAIHLDGESVANNVALAVHPFGPSPEVDLAFRESPPGPPENPPLNVNVPPGSVWAKTDGYVVAVASQPLFYESMQRQMFGLASLDATAALDVIRPGTIVLAYTPFDGRLHGVFEAISALEHNWDPLAFSNTSPSGPNNQKQKSQLPMQFKFRTVLPCGPLHENALVLAFRHRAGVYRTEELQPLINLFATKTKQGEIQPALKSAAIESVERGMPPPLVVPKGISFGDPQSLPGGGLWKQSCMVNIDFDPRFKAPNRLIGKNGMNMQMVKEKSGCNRAKVFAGDEAPAEGVMEIVFEAPTKESLDESVRLTKELLDELLRQWEEYKERGIRMKMERQGMIPGGPQQPPSNVPGGSGPPPRGMPSFPPQVNNNPGGFPSRGGGPPPGMMMNADPSGMIPPHDMSMPPSFPPPQGVGGPRGPGGFMMPPRGVAPPPGFVPRGPPPSMTSGPPPPLPNIAPRNAPQQQLPPMPEPGRRGGDFGGEDQPRSGSVPNRDGGNDDKRRGGPPGGGGRRRSPSPAVSRRRRSPSPGPTGGRGRGGGGRGGGGGERKDSRDRHRKRDRSRERGSGGGGADKRRRRN